MRVATARRAQGGVEIGGQIGVSAFDPARAAGAADREGGHSDGAGEQIVGSLVQPCRRKVDHAVVPAVICKTALSRSAGTVLIKLSRARSSGTSLTVERWTGRTAYRTPIRYRGPR